MNQPMQEQPKVKQLSMKRDFKIQKNGDVILIEKVETEVTFTGRQFISYKRQHESGITDINSKLSKETLEAMKKHKTELEELLKPIVPICEKVDKIMRVQHIEQQKTQTTNQLKHMLNQKEVNTNMIGAIWSQVPEEHKKDILKALTKKERTKLLNIKIDKMKTQRGK